MLLMMLGIASFSIERLRESLRIWMLCFCGGKSTIKLYTKKKFANLIIIRIIVYLCSMNKKKSPLIATHPGEMIKDELKERNMTQKQLSELTGIKPSVLSETINGKRSISLSVAMALEKALGIPAEIWMNLQTQYDIDSANIEERNKQKETVSVTIPVGDLNLLREISRKFGWACMF